MRRYVYGSIVDLTSQYSHIFEERLRTKIIDRLLKEGSSADEPLNIPLSDYSSDEGDTSSSSSSENEGKSTKLSDLEGPCCQPLKAPPCSPEIGAIDAKDGRKVRKGKSKIKSANLHKRSKKQNRTPLDLPTTDPGSDIHFSTDDELSDDLEAGDGYSTVPRARRTLMQSELQRRYIEGHGDQLKMPPELIVTPAKKKHGASTIVRLNTDDMNMEKIMGISNKNLTEFPPIPDCTTRRTNSWHSLHNKCVPKIRVQNPNNIYNLDQNNETLQFKLSLKKKIWSGVTPENKNGSSGERNRPLSWGIPPIHKRETEFKDDQEELLIACSQKLLIWQEKEFGATHNDFNERRDPQVQIKNKVTINLIVPTMLEKPSSSKTRRSGKLSKLEKLDSIPINSHYGSSNIGVIFKSKKKSRNPLTKIAETTQLLTLAKSKAKSTLSNRKSTNSTGANNASGTLLLPLSKGNKFKTGGIVATTTATVQNSSRKKKFRSVPALKNGITGQQDSYTSPLNDSFDLNKDKQLKRSKSKTKKKKSKTN